VYRTAQAQGIQRLGRRGKRLTAREDDEEGPDSRGAGTRAGHQAGASGTTPRPPGTSRFGGSVGSEVAVGSNPAPASFTPPSPGVRGSRSPRLRPAARRRRCRDGRVRERLRGGHREVARRSGREARALHGARMRSTVGRWRPGGWACGSRRRRDLPLRARRAGAPPRLLLGAGHRDATRDSNRTALVCPPMVLWSALVARESDSASGDPRGLQSVRLPADAGSGRFDSYPLPPTSLKSRVFVVAVPNSVPLRIVATFRTWQIAHVGPRFSRWASRMSVVVHDVERSKVGSASVAADSSWPPCSPFRPVSGSAAAVLAQIVGPHAGGSRPSSLRLATGPCTRPRPSRWFRLVRWKIRRLEAPDPPAAIDDLPQGPSRGITRPRGSCPPWGPG